MVDTDDIIFIFPGICPECQKGRAKSTGQRLDIHDIHESGWPLCPLCDVELVVNDKCHVD